LGLSTPAGINVDRLESNDDAAAATKSTAIPTTATDYAYDAEE